MKKLSYDFVKEQIEKEGYKLLSKEYKNANSKIELECDKGHRYEAIYAKFYIGRRCPECQHPSKKHSYSYVKNKIEQEGYKLLSKEYKNNRQKLLIKCDKKHEFELSWHKFVTGTRCLVCSGNQKLTYDYVTTELEKIGYELLSKEYKNAINKIRVKCDKGHEYLMTYGNFKQGKRCPKCFGSYSKAEKELVKYLKSLEIEVIENNKNIISPLELDIVIPEHNIAIEYCGLYWHSEEAGKNRNYHLNKLEQCKERGYRLITIFEDEWLFKQEIIKNRLKHILGLETNRIYARNCEVKEISTKPAREFIEKYHIQGYTGSSVKLGAFNNHKIVAVMTFSKPSLAKGRKDNSSIDIFELSRFCTSKNVVGIASKLLTHFQRNYEWKEIYSFADRRWSEGHLYETIGMNFVKNTKPNYFYWKNNIRHHRFNFRKDVLKHKLETFDPNKTEYWNMLENGWNRIWDCGNRVYKKC